MKRAAGNPLGPFRAAPLRPPVAAGAILLVLLGAQPYKHPMPEPNVLPPAAPAAATPFDGLPAVSPDEMEYVDALDNIIPTRGYQLTPLVALGGSAGSIAALQTFFQEMPEDSGMVFVVILHLSPTHHSSLPELLGRITAMPVEPAGDGQKVEANHVYVIPPGHHLATVDGHLRLSDIGQERGKRVAVDFFLRSLADTHGPHAAAVILSGADGDGAIGIKRIKERGGLTVAQDPDEAEHPSMPRSAIDTGMVDWVLPVRRLPERLRRYFEQEKIIRLPPEEGPPPAQVPRATPNEHEASLREVLAFLRMRTGRDFSYYKRATIVRRIGRRMQVNGVDDLPAYLEFLRGNPGEAGALLQDLLISVTNFFRDREAFVALEGHIPELFRNKGQSDTLRVWVPACATGEEAYSIAMLLLEHARTLDAPPTLQVFACDLDADAVQTARAGFYPDTIAADVSDTRLRHFFVKESHGYRVRRELREMILFATHDLLKDAPFSRMDLISCRNLLIYLNREAQQRALEIFHFALRPLAFLFLGSSESIEDGHALFRTLDKKNRLFYGQLTAVRPALPLPAGSSSLSRAAEAQERTAHYASLAQGQRFGQEAAVPFAPPLGNGSDRSAPAELHYRLVERLAPPSLIVNAEHRIIHFTAAAGRFLQFSGGEIQANLLRLIHPDLRIELRSALYRSAETGAPAEAFQLPVFLDGEPRGVNLRVSPAQDIAPGYLLVTFETTTPAAGRLAAPLEGSAVPIVHQLERELEQSRAQLRDTVEQYEASTEELKASNEELQAMNEELRSATEELETSREELESINEELTTVNHEMKGKVEELAGANSDLQNLMASTAIALVFLDRALTITRYTPTAVGLFHLIPGDLGRPLADLRHQLDYPELIDDAEKVLRTLIPVEREVREGGHWYLARLQPYRTQEDVIAGVVLTFVDITERKEAAEHMRAQITEAARFNDLAVTREARMLELKEEINRLAHRLGEEPPYALEIEPKDEGGR